jgi:hypothetical protein
MPIQLRLGLADPDPGIAYVGRCAVGRRDDWPCRGGNGKWMVESDPFASRGGYVTGGPP